MPGNRVGPRSTCNQFGIPVQDIRTARAYHDGRNLLHESVFEQVHERREDIRRDKREECVEGMVPSKVSSH